ncbi:MAG: zinc ribbon domain-containing protein, partial [Candidatus Thermoplasmatota archaeon]
RAIQRHDVRLVREFFEEKPLIAEAWYFGKTKERKDKLIIRASVLEDSKVVEFFVASNSILVVTGLLAELKNDFMEELKIEKLTTEQITDEKIINEIMKKVKLIEKHSEIEAKPQDAVLKKYCPNCKKEVRHGWKRCPYCMGKV